MISSLGAHNVLMYSLYKIWISKISCSIDIWDNIGQSFEVIECKTGRVAVWVSA